MVKNDNRKIAKPKDINNEFENLEIEEKFQVLGEPKRSLLKELGKALIKTKKFSKVKGLEEEFKWIFFFDYYATCKKDELRQTFQIIHHESTPKFWIRTKSFVRNLVVDCGSKKNWILIRKEKTDVINKPYSKKLLTDILKEKLGKLGQRDLVRMRLTRRKYYTFLKNIKTGRTFSLSLDFCRSDAGKMSQLEIEYKWRDKNKKRGFKDIDSLVTEFKEMNLVLMDSDFSCEFSPTKLTKFEWLVLRGNI